MIFRVSPLAPILLRSQERSLLKAAVILYTIPPLASANPLLPSIDPRMIDFNIFIGKRGEVRSRNPRIHALPSSRLSPFAAHFIYFIFSIATFAISFPVPVFVD